MNLSFGYNTNGFANHKLEDALDQCEDVGNVLQSIALKNA